MEVTLSVRKEYSFDVCVLGGGPAGFAAAVAAGRLGAKTLLVEKYGLLGGAMTVGGIPLPGLFHSLGEGGHQVIAGIGWELMTRLAEKGWAVLPQPPFCGPHPAKQVPVNGFAAACEMDDLCREAGVAAFFHQQGVEVLMDGQRITAVLLSGKDGLQAVKARVFVDCTGDGDIACMAGAPYELGEPLQPGSLNVVFEGIDPERVDQAAADAAFARAIREGRLHREDVWAGGGKSCRSVWSGLGSNLNHVYPLNGADSESRSRAEPAAHASVRRLLAWMRSEVPGCEQARVASCSPEAWARESRRILGLSYVSAEDYVRGRVPADAVCYSYYPIDVHREDASPLHNVWLDGVHVPGIPLGALIPQNTDNLLTAGRCISGDREAQSAFRVQASCMATGQAAGTAAALAARRNIPIPQLPASAVRESLRRQGAIVPD